LTPSRLYLDEDVQAGVATGLRRRGFDVLTTAEAERLGSTDGEQLRFAVVQARCLFTFNRGDYAALHTNMMDAGEHHFGIVVSRQVRIGAAVRMLSRLLSTHGTDELRHRLIWLPSR
jgi:hypothetical protein